VVAVVLLAGDGADGVQQARRYRPDLIVMDIRLPVLDGISAVLELKADATTACMPVAFVSGDMHAAGRARAAGGARFLAKPVRAAELVTAIARTLHSAAGDADRCAPRPNQAALAGSKPGG
jgi:CheY-like chemotaxis protein